MSGVGATLYESCVVVHGPFKETKYPGKGSQSQGGRTSFVLAHPKHTAPLTTFLLPASAIKSACFRLPCCIHPSSPRKRPALTICALPRRSSNPSRLIGPRDPLTPPRTRSTAAHTAPPATRARHAFDTAVCTALSITSTSLYTRQLRRLRLPAFDPASRLAPRAFRLRKPPSIFIHTLRHRTPRTPNARP